jgi:hypothetical protein
MNMTKCTFGILISLCVLYGCDEMMVGPDPENTPENNFDILWKDFDRYYAQFSLRHIDWDSVYTLYHSQIGPSTSDRQLFGIFSDIVLGINDMHVSVYTPMGDVQWKSMVPASYPSRRIVNAGKYVRSGAPQNAVFEYRTFNHSWGRAGRCQRQIRAIWQSMISFLNGRI